MNMSNFFYPVGVGSMMMGWRLDYKNSERIISIAHDHEIFFLDSSVSYARGDAHKIIAKALKKLKLKDKFFIATKIGGMSEDLAPKKDIGFSKKNIIRQCEIALNQLCVESIDLLQLHYPVKDGDYAEILETLDLLKNQGKIKNYGLCNFQGNDVAKILCSAKKQGINLPITNQFEYNLLNHSYQKLLFSEMRSRKIHTITWGSLSSGLLTDWYLTNSNLKPDSRIKIGKENQKKSILLRENSTKKIIRNISSICKESGISPQVFSVGWVIHQQPNNCLLLGPSSPSQFDELISGINKLKEMKINFNFIENEL